MSKALQTLSVAVPAPLYQCFDYLAPAEPELAFGSRVRVPFGRRSLIGLVVGRTADSEIETAKLKSIEESLDDQPLVPETWLALCHWVAAYYHHPIGEVIATALPASLRKGQAARYLPPRGWALTESGHAALQNSKRLQKAARQRKVLECLAKSESPVLEELLRRQSGTTAAILRTLADKNWIRASVIEEARPGSSTTGPVLSKAQQTAVDIALGKQAFHPSLLEGVTGSGKTEVYLSIARHQAEAGRQTLVLVPEIGLTPALIERFTERLGNIPAVLHSGLSDGERLHAWQRAARGDALVVIGTRSAIFTPLARPGAIIVDEEHDASLKQQDGLRYSARDVAVRRAQMENIPIMLGSATPSLETLHNARSGRYQLAELPDRIGRSELPSTEVIDLRRQPMFEGMSLRLLNQVDRHLEENGQILLFLNRRGFASSLICHDCGWVANCQRCDVPLTYHRGGSRLRCHHCGSDRPTPPKCPDCNGSEFVAQGVGTERIEEFLRERYPGTGLVRIDRDTTRRKNALNELLDEVNSQRAKILIGTQMLAKGHDFPELSMVGILNTDGGLFSIDFRAPERMAQLITQVAGRAGRGEKPGEVFIQTHHPDHPLLLGLLRDGYNAFARQALAEREMAGYPPFGHLCLIRAEATHGAEPVTFLQSVAKLAQPHKNQSIEIWEAVPAPMERRAGRFRAQLLIQATRRKALHQLLSVIIPRLNELPNARKVRWSVDVDPVDML